MKFGRQIRFVAVKAWYDNYFPYTEFKHLIKQYIQRMQETMEFAQSQEAVHEELEKCNDEFIGRVHDEGNKITSFYVNQYLSAQSKLGDLRTTLNDQLDQEDPRSEEAEKMIHQELYSILFDLYELRTYLALNRTAGQKIVKKYSRKMEVPYVRQEYLETEQTIYNNLPDINILISDVEDMYVILQREVNMEPNTKSRPEVILELHTTVESSLLWKQSTVLARFDAMTFRHNELLLKPNKIKQIPIIISLIFLLAFQFAQFTSKFDYRAQRCTGIVAWGSILWATSAIPLWLTSLSVPFLGVVCQVLPMSMADIGKEMLHFTVSPTVWLTIGGFTIAAAMRVTELDSRVASICLRKAAKNRRVFLLVVSGLNAFIAMWISNITSTMIVLTLVVPTLKQISTDSQYAKMVLFSIAFGGNIGGMITPLASPQNAVTVENVESAARRVGINDSVSFVEFFATALPFSILLIFVGWIVIQLKFKIDIQNVPPLQPVKTEFGWRQIFVSIISIAIIAVWISLPFGGKKIFSDFGIVGFLPVLIFYGTGILQPPQIAELPWNIIFLLMGGNGLCKIVTDSGLMAKINQMMNDALKGWGTWLTILVINVIVLILDFFLTHTVSSMITLPLVCNYAATTGHLRLYAMCACMITTASQILPVSSFPNMCTATLQDPNGKNYMTNNDMIKWGILITIICLALTMSAYYGIAVAYGM